MGWNVAPVSFRPDWPRRTWRGSPRSVGEVKVEQALAGWLFVEAEILMDEIEDRRRGCRRYCAAKSTRVDRAPDQIVDVHELLADAHHAGAETRRRHRGGDESTTAPSLPFPPTPPKLNQVRTSLHPQRDRRHGWEAAADHPDASRDEESPAVGVGDTGPACRRIRSRIFEPFFTTKPFPAEAGLGLDIRGASTSTSITVT